MRDLQFPVLECILGLVDSEPLLARFLVSVQQSRLSTEISFLIFSSTSAGLRVAVVLSYCIFVLKWISEQLRALWSGIASGSSLEADKSL